MKLKALVILRIVFCVLACNCAAVAVPIGIFFEWWCLVPVAGACAFGVAMLMLKNAAARAEVKPHTDFMNTDEENEKIRTEQEKRETK